MPRDYTEAQMKALLTEFAGPEVVKANVASYLSMKKQGRRYDGATTVVSTMASDVSDVGYALEVVVTRCIDQRGIKLLDKTGADVSDSASEVADFNLRQYTVQRRTGEDRFRVYGTSPAKGTCGP
ncbi:MAG: hypothetical protein WAL91_06260 [Propionicimonas sp.]